MNLTTTTTFRSDHDPILVEIDFTKFLSEKSYWRHINALLKDPQYVYRIKNHFRLTLAKYVIKHGFNNFYSESSEQELQEFINQENAFSSRQEYGIDPHLLFEMILNDCRCESISFSAEKRNTRGSKFEEKFNRGQKFP